MYLHAFQLLAALLTLYAHRYIDRSMCVHISACFYTRISTILTSMYT